MRRVEQECNHWQSPDPTLYVSHKGGLGPYWKGEERERRKAKPCLFPSNSLSHLQVYNRANYQVNMAIRYGGRASVWGWRFWFGSRDGPGGEARAGRPGRASVRAREPAPHPRHRRRATDKDRYTALIL